MIVGIRSRALERGSKFNALARFERAVVIGERTIMFLVVMAMLVLLLLQILARAGLSFPVDYSDELARLLLMWLIFVGAAHGTSMHKHFCVDFIIENWKFGGKRVLELSIILLTIAFLGILFWVSARTTMVNSVQQFPALGISVAWSNASLPTGLFLMVFHTLMLLWGGVPIGEEDQPEGVA